MSDLIYEKETQEFETLIDFVRFGLSRAQSMALHYGHGTDNALDDMYALILGLLSLPMDIDAQLLQGRLTQAEKRILCDGLHKRIEQRIPVPYITQQAYFAELAFYVDERVLIPRSPISELIRQQFTPWINPMGVERVLDLCTGSGCIAIACCYAFPNVLVDAVDISPQALEVATINREKFGLEDSLTLIESDCFDSVPALRYDIVVSNPPYVGYEEMQTLPREYQHEPALALETSNNGLAIVERILHQAHEYLTEQGILVVEVGNSEEALIDAYPDLPFTWLEFEHGGQGVFLLTSRQLREYFS